jgi:gluconolactonase
LAQKSKSVVAPKAQLVKLYDKCIFTEGPAADKFGNVYFTDQPNNRIMKWSIDGQISVFMENSGRSNGLYFDKDGNLLACADEKNELWKINQQGKVVVLLSGFENKTFNGPNDLWIDPKGGIYFTDPYYKRDYWVNHTKDMKKQNLYYLMPDLKTVLVADSNLVQPNGIIGSPDGKWLYVADIGDSKTYRYIINKDGTLSNREKFIDYGSDGMTLDNKGNLYITGKGVTVFDKQGRKIDHIAVDQSWTANVTFGGKQKKTLFITAMNALYSIETKVKGAQ